MKIRLVHGIHSPEGNNNMSALQPHIEYAFKNEGAKVSLFSYGFMGFWAARWKNRDVAYDLYTEHFLEKSDEPEVWIVHSNGAAIAYLAVKEFGAKPDMIININPALDRKKTAAVQHVITIHSEQDRAVDFSQWLPFHIWGDQGKVGYKGKWTNTENYNASTFSEPMKYQGHTELFNGIRISQWSWWMKDRIMEKLG